MNTIDKKSIATIRNLTVDSVEKQTMVIWEPP